MILTFKRLSLLTLVFLGMTAFHTVKADPIKLYTTGVNDAGVTLAAGTIDSHYQLLPGNSGGAGNSAQNAYVMGGATGSPGAGWADNTAGSKWITNNPGGIFDTPTGTYTFRTTFTIDPTLGYDLSTASISGTAFADDRFRIFINGVDVGVNLPNGGGSGWAPGTLSSFLISSGFQFGVNTIDFVVSNTPAVPTPVGLQVTTLTGNILRGATPPASVPEPTTLILIGTGLAGIAARARRKKA
jgi:PEP-CTERM motif